MPQPIIEVKHLSKQYKIGADTTYKTLSGSITDTLRSPLKSLKNFNKQNEIFWALKDINFEVNRGEVVGIIGRNGAGKSTLLKVLSRITHPTEGEIRLRGRVGSLLEVGTGFHPELTGRENVYFNGAILGMKKREIDEKFDDIVRFAEIDKFLDTPVKRYSSGMYVRLAFAVAAHMDPEILIVDEVLAVGDAQFQKKCLGKMSEVAEGGRTVLFVSHNMPAIESLCNRGILIESGTLSLNSSAQEAVKIYLEKAYQLGKCVSLDQRKDRSGSGRVIVSSFRISDEEGKEVTSLQSGKDYYFEIGYLNHINEYLNNVVVSLDLFDERGMRVMLLRSNFSNASISLKSDKGEIICGVENLPLANGLYRFSIFLSHADSEILDYIEDAASITVDGGDFFGTGSNGLPTHCKILVKSQWSSTAHDYFPHKTNLINWR